jgi:hypothetical protein
VLSGLGGGGDLRAAYRKATSLRITLSNVHSDRVAPMQIGQFLNQRPKSWSLASSASSSASTTARSSCSPRPLARRPP